MKKMRKGLTLIELLIVIAIIGILAGASVPLIRGRVDQAKWSEANAAAGMIRQAVAVYHSREESCPVGRLDETALLKTLELRTSDLTGSYFVPGDYEIVSVTPEGVAVIRVTGSRSNAPNGSRTLAADGTWK